MRTEARFPAAPPDAGHYESFFLKAAAPEGRRALWIRHTIHKRPGEEPTGAVWMTYFDGDGPRAAKQQFGADHLAVPDGAYLRVDGSEIGPGWARGECEAGGVAASWGLRFSDRHEALRHLPAEWMYRGRLPRTKLLSPHPGALFDGTLELDGERVDMTAWPGAVGHNWGSQHAERWTWIHATGFEGGGPTDYLDIAAARVGLGPITSPWIANGRLVLNGEALRLGGLGRTYGTELGPRPTACTFTVPGPRVNLRGSVGAPADRFVGWRYSDPGGNRHDALNCSISDLEVRVERPGRLPVHLRLEGAAVYETGMPEGEQREVPIQPFEDG